MSSIEKRQVRVLISGRVQGVGFRMFAQRHARQLGVTGFVRNVSTSQVEVVAAGDPKSLDNFLSLLSRGPQLARVDSIQVEKLPVRSFTSFFIRY